MERAVLCLSSSFVPLGTTNWQKAMTWVISGRATVVEEYEDWTVRSAYKTWNVPSVIKFVKMVAGYFRKGVKFNRKNVWVRDKGTCGYCGKKVSQSEFTFDHVLPRRLGGKTEWANISTCCLACNQRKKDRTPEQAGMKLLSKPICPKSLPGVPGHFLTWGAGMPEAWRSFLYWHEPLDG